MQPVKGDVMSIRVLAIIPTLADDPTETINSVVEQTVKVSRILVAVGSKFLYQRLASTNPLDAVEYIYVEPDFRDPLGKRVATELNAALSNTCLEDYDYLLRVDADTVLSHRFIEENLKAGADCVGEGGCAMLIKIDSFIKFFDGRFPEVGAEDSYIMLKLLSRGCSVKPWVLPPKLKRRSGAHHPWRYHFVRGVEMYKLGYEPIHVFKPLLHDIRGLLIVLGYFMGLLKKARRYEFAGWVFRRQLRRLIFKGQT
ncbi:MAG: glycosyltransferase family A protein [Candidatus Bathyarchaeia archaeon]